MRPEAEAAAAEMIEVEVVLALPERVAQRRLRLPQGASVAQAVAASGLLDDSAAPAQLEGNVGIWGRHCQPQDPVAAGDRIELYRPLSVDPMVARRRRAAKAARSGRTRRHDREE